jgi:hypothetical protein
MGVFRDSTIRGAGGKGSQGSKPLSGSVRDLTESVEDAWRHFRMDDLEAHTREAGEFMDRFHRFFDAHMFEAFTDKRLEYLNEQVGRFEMDPPHVFCCKLQRYRHEKGLLKKRTDLKMPPPRSDLFAQWERSLVPPEALMVSMECPACHVGIDIEYAGHYDFKDDEGEEVRLYYCGRCGAVFKFLPPER